MKRLPVSFISRGLIQTLPLLFVSVLILGFLMIITSGRASHPQTSAVLGNSSSSYEIERQITQSIGEALRVLVSKVLSFISP